MSIDGILLDRGKTHGDWESVATTAQALKGRMRASCNWPKMSSKQKESVDLICTKLARIAHGDPDHADHWDDIAGYAKLGKEDVL